MTEDEAKSKWCPFARLITTADGVASIRMDGAPAGYNRYSGAPEQVNRATLCIGSACMAWRPRESVEFTRQAATEFRNSGKRLINVEGFCGLAGAPA